MVVHRVAVNLADADIALALHAADPCSSKPMRLYLGHPPSTKVSLHQHVVRPSQLAQREHDKQMQLRSRPRTALCAGASFRVNSVNRPNQAPFGQHRGRRGAKRAHGKVKQRNQPPTPSLINRV